MKGMGRKKFLHIDEALEISPKKVKWTFASPNISKK